MFVGKRLQKKLHNIQNLIDLTSFHLFDILVKRYHDFIESENKFINFTQTQNLMKVILYLIWLIITGIIIITMIPLLVMYTVQIEDDWFRIGDNILNK